MRKIAFCLVVAVLLFPIPIVSRMQSLGPKERLESAKLSKEEIQEITGEVGIKDFTIVTNSSPEAGERITDRFDGEFYRSR